MTKKLYDLDSHLQSFQGRVLACKEQDGTYGIVLDQTAFFPPGGGQAADTGTLHGIPVMDVSEQEQCIVHWLMAPIAVGTEVIGLIDWDTRFRRMQNHSGEHIVSGLIHQLYGYDNVGFHMGSQAITIDYNGVLTAEEVKRIERLANEAVVKNVAVSARYPSPEELEGMTYRSKLALTENIRIVSIEGYDICACCAPHVSHTGEIGLIKLLDCSPHKKGVRINMLCGYPALEDYQKKFEQVLAISKRLSSKPDGVSAAVEQLLRSYEEAKQALSSAYRELAQAKIQAIPQTEGNLILFEEGWDPATLRDLVNAGMQRCSGICAAFSEEEGAYRYVLGSNCVDVSALGKEMNQALHGRGGGSASMIQGSVQSTKGEIEAFFAMK